MKMRTIAKTSLALGLLTTGAITVTTQSVKAEKIQSTKVDKVPTLKAERLAMINITAGANSATTQAANTRQERTPKLEKAPNTNEEKTSASKIEKISQPKQEEQKTLNISATPAPKQEQSQTTTESTTPKTKVTTPPSTNTPQPMQSTKSDTPQSPTTKQVPTEINPKFKDLRAYYTKPSLEFKNEIGIILKKWTTIRFMNVVPDYFIYKIALVGKDDKKYGEGVHRNVDVFVVLEENNYNLEKYSVGGITKSNSKKVDHKAGVRITKEDNKGTISHDVSEFKITKEQISLKELDFKLRKQLIEKNNLYGNVGSGKIVIKMKNGGKYTFELHKKLQENRMADVIDGTNIDNIEVNIK
ncbi:TPA: superantigen-like protein SSL3 [Staphylococcus aureus]|uniref:Superantigen-like protein SSL3 n=28 Tax=Staphylococcus TaxID=1279 RepID=A0AAQ1HWX6_STAAU|nr:superantigen-like protein SSL3 [Staphylococcus aureus]HEH9896693.1 superantigen-like protein SSL3 [Staphylococcus aureus CI8]AVT84422.1 superantigen-like protein SSL3 [Staphylococcus aureus]AWI92524.1 superantigen-like protein SSL3 [Staphylococcus aureus]EHT51066.1 superantigen-like protein 11 [Staphylococcus aureus subsp. aureus CIG547]EJX2403438.1 superantigen-like protein SSL3 [Staphylococcus aureus]